MADESTTGDLQGRSREDDQALAPMPGGTGGAAPERGARVDELHGARPRPASAQRAVLPLPRGVAQVRPEAPAAVLMVSLAERQVVYANPTATQMAPGVRLPVAIEAWSAAADLRDLDGEALTTTDHPLTRVARFEPVAGQGVSAARESALGPRREPLWVVALPLEEAPNLAGQALVVFLPVRDREVLQERVAAAHAAGTERAEHEAAGAVGAADQAAVREAAVLATGLSFTVADARAPDMPLVWVNPAFTAVTGYAFDAVVGRNCRFLQGPGTDPATTAAIRQALAEGESITVTLLNYRADGTAFWNQLAMSPVIDADGVVTHFVGIQTDVSGRVAADAERDRALSAERAARAQAQAAHADAEASHERLRLLGEVTRQLSDTADAEQALNRLARLVVPLLGDFAVLAVVEDDAAAPVPGDVQAVEAADVREGAGAEAPAQERVPARPARSPGRGLRDVAWSHHDPGQLPLLTEHVRPRLRSLSPAGREAVHGTLVDGRTRVTTGTAEVVGQVLAGDDGHRALAGLEPTSVAHLALRGRERAVGLLTLATGPGRAGLSAADVQLGEEVAARAGLALDNARLYRQQRDLAAGLQRSLLSLTAVPQPDHVQLAVRYVAAAEAAQVGGDFYDAFVQPGGATMVVIGDVMGHDTQAAAAMAQLRSMVRALGAVGDDGPAAVLARTDRVMAALGVDTIASAFAARLEQPGPDPAGGSEQVAGEPVTRLVWSNAGHPPAVVVDPDGRLRDLGTGSDLLLGVDPAAPRHQGGAGLPRGATLVLFTDGLVERRDVPLDTGLERLRSTLVQLVAAGLDLETLLDELLTRMVPDRPGDDVAVLAVRLHPEDRPRPDRPH